MGGAEVALVNVLATLKEAAPDWKLDLIVSDAGPLVTKAEALGVTTTILPFPTSLARIGDASAGGPSGKQASRMWLLGRLVFAGPGIAAYRSKLRRLLRRLSPDVIHTNGFKMHVLGALAKPDEVPLVWHMHDYVKGRPLAGQFIKWLRKRCALVLANSDSVKRDVESVCGDSLPVQRVYNVVDTRVFNPAGATLDLDSLANLTPAAPSTVRVGMVTTFARWKGQTTFLKALSLVPAGIPLRGYIIGGPLYTTEGSQYSTEELRAEADRLGVLDRLGFTGFVANPAEAMRSLDIVVHASTQPEPFGLVIIEGMASGRAVIMSESGGAAELMQNENGAGPNAFGHRPGDAAKLAECIIQLARDPQLRARLGAAGRVTAERFDRQQLGAELVPIYRRLAAERV
jgi:glycosyltransferase involved in cell wall biosynthesis